MSIASFLFTHFDACLNAGTTAWRGHNSDDSIIGRQDKKAMNVWGIPALAHPRVLLILLRLPVSLPFLLLLLQQQLLPQLASDI